MKKWIVILSLVAAVTVVIGVLIVERAQKVMVAREEWAKPVTVPPPAVTVDRVVSHDFVHAIEVSGEVHAKRVVMVFPKVGGRVEELNVELGGTVEVNAPIARIEENDLGFRERQGEAGTRAASAQVHAAAVQLENARVEVARAEELFKAQALPEAELTRIRGMRNAAEAALSAAKAQAEVARAGSDLAKEAKSWTVVESPIAGVVTKKMVEVGAQAGPQTPLVELQDQSELEIDVDVPPSVLDVVKDAQQKGTEVEFTIEERPGWKGKAKVKAVGLSLDPMTRRVHVELSVEGGVVKEGVLPLMIARVPFETGRQNGVIAVPRDAVAMLPDGAAVFVVREGKAVRLTPNLELADADHVAVEGARPDEQVVIEGQQGLKGGEAVNVTKKGDAKADDAKQGDTKAGETKAGAAAGAHP